MSHTVYISHNTSATDLINAFQRSGVVVCNGRSITQKADLTKQLQNADCLIALITDDWFNSQRCQIEMNYAREKGKLVFPVLISGNGTPDNDYIDLRHINDWQSSDWQPFVQAVIDDLDELKPHDPFEILDALPVQESITSTSIWKAPNGGPSNFVLGLVGAIVIFMAVVVVAFNLDNTQTPTVTIPDGWLFYDTSHVSFGLPEEWEVTEFDEYTSESIIYAAFIKRHSSDFIRIRSVPRNGIETLIQAAEAQHIPQDYTVTNMQMITLPAGQTLKILATRGFQQYLFTYITLHANRIHTITIRASQEQWHRIEPTIETFIQTYVIKA